MSIFKRFGDEHSALFDRHERLSFEVQLNKAMLCRSLSEPAVARCPLAPPKQLALKPRRAVRRVSGFKNAMKKLFSPIFGRKAANDGVQNPNKDPIFRKTFTRSLRV